MADKTISDLPAAAAIYDNDLFLLEQSGEAKNLRGALYKAYLQGFVDAASSASAEAAMALAGVRDAINNIPEGAATPIINDLTTGGTKMALSAEMGKTLGQRPNPNLLDNWYFGNPVNQRGETEYVGSGYSIDRWKGAYATDTISLVDGGVKVKNNRESGATYWRQNFERRLPPGEYTLSALVIGIENNSGANISLYLSNNTGYAVGAVAVASKTGLIQTHVTVNETEVTRVQFAIPLGASITLAAVKLEIGNKQTLAHQDGDGNWVLNEIPDYSAMAAQSKRYFERIAAPSANLTLGVGTAGNATKLYVALPLRPKRVTPSASALANCLANIRYGTSTLNATPTAMSIYSIDLDSGICTLDITGTFVAGEAYRVGIVADGYIDFDSDL